MKTKAVRLYGEKDLRLEEFELPAIGENEILAKQKQLKKWEDELARDSAVLGEGELARLEPVRSLEDQIEGNPQNECGDLTHGNPFDHGSGTDLKKSPHGAAPRALRRLSASAAYSPEVSIDSTSR